jgi:hypothetical protein
MYDPSRGHDHHNPEKMEEHHLPGEAIDTRNHVYMRHGHVPPQHKPLETLAHHHSKDLRHILYKRHGLDRFEEKDVRGRDSLMKLSHRMESEKHDDDYVEHEDYEHSPLQHEIVEGKDSKKHQESLVPAFIRGHKGQLHTVMDLRKSKPKTILDRIKNYGQKNKRRSRNDFSHSLHIYSKSGQFDKDERLRNLSYQTTTVAHIRRHESELLEKSKHAPEDGKSSYHHIVDIHREEKERKSGRSFYS